MSDLPKGFQKRMIREEALRRVGCCGAPSKETCTDHPCPCNMDAYSPQELNALGDKEKERHVNRWH